MTIWSISEAGYKKKSIMKPESCGAKHIQGQKFYPADFFVAKLYITSA